ncbi:hypothetical protein RISK_002666 [Rhodopirellula islandica]|uniref:Uncharacterized protein n=1 Tax=Rhodopirellula islandica TaxID=595434 RepID=A0A0J1BFD7_RHOIS|nr:hypothetical protein RISK_002666 [Rhodopirellula islandica]
MSKFRLDVSEFSSCSKVRSWAVPAADSGESTEKRVPLPSRVERVPGDDGHGAGAASV